MKEKLNYGYVEPKDFIESNLQTIENYEIDEIDEDDEDEKEEIFEIPLYDLEKSKEDNLETGIKYLILPIYKDRFGKVVNQQLLSEYTKIVTKQENLFECNSEGHDLLVVDYATIFGLRLNRFIKYDSKFFLCDERVLFEFLIMKHEYFGFKPFFLSFTTIFKDMGIKKDRAISIFKKFRELAILDSEIKTDLINGKPSQITFYSLKTDKIIELIPKIYVDDDTLYNIKHDIEKYLMQDNKKGNRPVYENYQNKMQ